MHKTYCDLTASYPKKTFALHISENELILISELINSVSDERATHLRKVIDNEIRTTQLFDLRSKTTIIQCKNCNGTGFIKVMDNREQYYQKHFCTKCQGTGRKVKITTKRFEPFSNAWKEKLSPCF